MKSSKDTGMAFVNTMNLDGETNLKERMCLKEIKQYNEQDLLNIKIELEYDKPNDSLESFDGTMSIAGLADKLKVEPKNLMLRGCFLKNTQLTYGLVIYTGHTTKIMMNAKNPPTKVSKVLHKMNHMLYSVFGFQMFILVLFSSLSIAWRYNNADDHPYIDTDGSPGVVAWFLQFLAYWVAYSHLIPISLYVMLEIVKLAQSYLISQDNSMHEKVITNRRASCRTSDLIEELGQVELIFSDKTGTLTSNCMEYKQCTLNQKIYGDKFKSQNYESINIETTKSLIKNKSPDKEYLDEFFKIICVCHSVVVEEVGGKRKYQAASPDELALVDGAKNYDYIFNNRTIHTIEYTNPDGVHNIYELLQELPFDNDRKRMSVIVKKKGEGKLWLFTKGADSSMLGNCMGLSPNDKEVIDTHLYNFAVQGLRTLVMGQKQLSEVCV